MNVDDLATTLDASEVCDMTDVGRLTSPLFFQQREVSAISFGVSCSQTQPSMEHPSEMLSRIQASGNRCRKVKRNLDLERVQDSQNGKGKNSVRTERHS